jgi:hypothetical protein
VLRFWAYSWDAIASTKLEMLEPIAASVVMKMLFGIGLLIILVLLLFGALPNWPYSTAGASYPSGRIGIVLLLMILLLTGRV